MIFGSSARRAIQPCNRPRVLTRLFGLVLAVFFFIADHAGHSAMQLTLTSPAFSHLEEMPKRYTCEGLDVSPPFAWSGIPEETKSLVLIIDDPDAPDPKAPKMTWVHWVLYNLPPTADGLPEAVAPDALPSGTEQGLNDWSKKSYGGPCPPIGRHRYFHKIYALNSILTGLKSPSKSQVEQAMEGHVIAHAELVGTYEKNRH